MGPGAQITLVETKSVLPGMTHLALRETGGDQAEVEPDFAALVLHLSRFLQLTRHLLAVPVRSRASFKGNFLANSILCVSVADPRFLSRIPDLSIPDKTKEEWGKICFFVEAQISQNRKLFYFLTGTKKN